MTMVTLGEGNTPLIRSARIGPALGLDRLFFKLENCNPSGSYKDRFVSAEVSRILDTGGRACIATSSGNTGSSLAAYCARTGISCAIVVNSTVPAGKLLQMQAHGARVLRIREFASSPGVTAQVYALLTRPEITRSLALVVSAYRYCPAGMAGVESMAAEMAAQCKEPIDHVFAPVGGGGLFTALCRGMAKAGKGRPRIHAVQPSGCSTVVAAFERGDSEIRRAESTTRISGLSVPFDIDASVALDELRRSGGAGLAVSDEEVFESQRMMLEQEGIFAEPAGAAALAGLRQAVRQMMVKAGQTTICVVTGSGFKDPESIQQAPVRHPPVELSVGGLEREIGRFTQCASR